MNPLHRVTRARKRRDQADDQYRRAIIGARVAGASYGQIARAAGTSSPNIIRIIQRNAATDNGTPTDYPQGGMT